jgi:anti-sigma B factor antagonist
LVAPVGELDLATRSSLHELLIELEASGPGLLVLDLRRLSFMDCSGLRILLKAQARTRLCETQLKVVCVPGQVRRLLALSRADRQLDVAEYPR